MSGAELPNTGIFAGKMAIHFFKEFVKQTTRSIGETSGRSQDGARTSEDVRLNSEIAVETAKEVTIGLYREIYSGIDADFLGLVHRQMSISEDYGTRLAKIGRNVKPGTIERLIYHYPDHDSAIDSEELKNLFVNVFPPDAIIEFVNEALDHMGSDVTLDKKVKMLACAKGRK